MSEQAFESVSEARDSPLIELGELVVAKPGSVNPAKYQDETFELYSIPAYEEGQPEIQPGSAIGSSKKLVQPSDVLLSRIVPHILTKLGRGTR